MTKRKSPERDGCLVGCKIFLVPKLSIAVKKPRRDILLNQITHNGGSSVGDPSEATHVLVDPEIAEKFPGAISVEWLCDCLAAGRRLADHKYRFSAPLDLPQAPEPPLEPVSFNLGPEIADAFEALGKTLSISKAEKPDEFRAKHYREAARLLRNVSDNLFSQIETFKSAPFHFGPSIIAKISEFVETGKISKLEYHLKDEHKSAIAKMSSVWGVGPVAAEKLWAQGVRSIEEMQNLPELTRAQKIGLKYWEELQLRISRYEVEEIIARVEPAIRRRFGPGVIVETAGSYRRGAPDCGDVDFLICSDGSGHKLWEVVEDLKQSGFITDKLNLGDDSQTYHTFYGICKVGSDRLHRRIDLKLWSKAEYPFALLHFTGSDHFNRLLRLKAKQDGFKLNDHGLYRNGSPIQCKSESEIFEALGFKYLPPNERFPENLVRI